MATRNKIEEKEEIRKNLALLTNDNTNKDQNTNLDILCGLMIEAANTDGEISQEEINKISNSLINIFKEETNEVEKALTEHPTITDCAVVGVPSDVGDEDIKAYIQITEGAERPSPLELTNWCKEKIAYFKTPRYIEFVHSFPRTMTKNEIARHELRELGIGIAWDATIDDWIEEK